jgi:hypothetical protein
MSNARRGGLAGLAAVAALVVGGAPAWAAPGDGSAYGAKVNVTLVGQPAVTAGPFAAANTNGPTSNSLANVTVPGILTTGVINTSATRDDTTGAVDSRASTADVALPVLGALGSVTATAVEAECHATQQGVTGSSTLTGLNLGTLGTVSATPAANTTVQIAAAGVNVAKLVFNEQIQNADGSLTVNALHLVLLGGVLGSIGTGDVIVSSATCGPAALPIPMASGAGLWIGLGLLAAIALPVGIVALRRRSAPAAG